MTLSKIKSKEPLWSKNYILLLINNLMVATIWVALATNLPLYLKGIGSSNMIVGMMTTVLTISMLAFRPIVGHLIDRVGRKMVLQVGLVVTIASCFFYILTPSIPVMFVLRAINGIGFSATTATISVMIVDDLPKSRMTEGIGYSGFPTSIAIAAGPVLGALMINKWGFQVFFIGVFCVSCVNLVFSWLLNYKKIEKTGQATDEKKKFAIKFASIKNGLLPAFVLLALTISMGSIESFVPTAGISRGIENISIFFTVYAIVALLIRVIAGKIADNYGFNMVLWPALIAFMLAFSLLAYAYSISIVIVAGVFYGIGNGITMTSLYAISMKECAADKRGIVLSMFFAAGDVGMGAGAFIWGGVSQWFGYTLMFILCAVVVAVGAVLYYLLLHRKLSKKIKQFETS